MLLFFNMPFLHLGHLGPEYTMMGTRSRLMVDNVIDTNTCNFARTITEIFSLLTTPTLVVNSSPVDLKPYRSES